MTQITDVAHPLCPSHSTRPLLSLSLTIPLHTVPLHAQVAARTPNLLASILSQCGGDPTVARDEIIGILMASHTTTSIVASCTLYQLAAAPDWADRVADEAKRVVSARRHVCMHPTPTLIITPTPTQPLSRPLAVPLTLPYIAGTPHPDPPHLTLFWQLASCNGQLTWASLEQLVCARAAILEAVRLGAVRVVLTTVTLPVHLRSTTVTLC